ncbi:MAG: alkaline phosphatase family protein [Candidatus Komeilibacteria bacterium]|nr:alkaline phosphatase family protein [Candidatus Komeilibacteria bacterium]
MPKVIVIGLDGGSWNYIQKWIDEGKLPAFKKFQQMGVWGILESQLPPVTSPNWKCFSTGLNPAKLGVFWWENVDVKNRKIYVPNARSFTGKEIFDYLSEAGFRVGVINMPTIYPPHKINGIMVSGGPDAMEEGFTYPAALENLLKSKFNYHVLPHNISFMGQGKTEVIEEIYRLIKVRFQAAEFLLEQGNFDFFMVAVYLINVLQHYHWGDEVVFKAWQIIDQGIGRLLEKYPTSAFYFMSDHGTNEIKIKFNISTWLEQRGYLKLKTSAKPSVLGKFGISKGRVTKLLTSLGLKDFVKKAVPKNLQQMLPDDVGHINFAGKAETIDWDNSQVIASGQGPLYLLNKDEAFKEKLIKELEALEHNGLKIVKKVYQKAEVYSGEFFNQAPDLIVDQAQNTHFSGSLGSKSVFEAPAHWKGENERKGLFLAYKQGLKPGKLDTGILNLAPTILNEFGIAKPEQMDGAVIKL